MWVWVVRLGRSRRVKWSEKGTTVAILADTLEVVIWCSWSGIDCREEDLHIDVQGILEP